MHVMGKLCDTKYPPGVDGHDVYDAHYDIDDHALAVAEKLLGVPAPHMAGLDPEQVDWEAHKAFFGELR